MDRRARTNAVRRGVLCAALLAALLFGLLLIGTVPTNAANVVASGDCGKDGGNVKWSLDSDGVLTISGKGEMADYSGPDASTWRRKYADSVRIVVIKDGVSAIGERAFLNCTGIIAVMFPEDEASSVTIGERAFQGCSGLTSITFSKSVVSIGTFAFADCPELQTITIINPACKMGSLIFSDSASAVIYGYHGSTAETYAGSPPDRHPFVDLDSNPMPPTHTHTYGAAAVERTATCKQTGLQVQVCAVCGDRIETVIPKVAHAYKKVVVSATMKKDGSVYKQCTVCGATGKKTAIAKIGSVKLSKTAWVYTGAARTPAVVVKDANGKALKKDTDYKVKYAAGCTECGKYGVKVVFMGKYSGKKTLAFQIVLGRATDVQQTDDKGIAVTWKKVRGATAYEVLAYRKKDGKYQLEQTVTIKNNRLVNASIPKGEVWRLKIRAARTLKDGSVVYGAYVAITFTAK